MYDRGYTSIGLMHNTVPNPALRLSAAEDTDSPCDSRAHPQFLPAYQLAGALHERDSRLDPTPSPPSASKNSSIEQSSFRILVLFNPIRMAGYLDRILQHVTSPPAGIGPGGVQVIVTSHRVTEKAAMTRLAGTLSALAAHSDVLVVGDYSEAGAICANCLSLCICDTGCTADWCEYGPFVSTAIAETKVKSPNRVSLSLQHGIEKSEEHAVLAIENFFRAVGV